MAEGERQTDMPDDPSDGGPADDRAAGGERTAPDADQAWNALGLVNDWIKHAETKSVASLAAAGVSGGVLFNLLKDRSLCGWEASIAVVAAALVLLAGGCAVLSLLPRLRLSRKPASGPTNPLYFDDIARTYPTDELTYIQLIRAVTGDAEELTRQIARQIHANSRVAQRKYRWANRSILFLSLALLGIAAIALIVSF